MVFRQCRNSGETQERIGKDLNKGSDSRAQEKRRDSQAKIQEVELTGLVCCKE